MGQFKARGDPEKGIDEFWEHKVHSKIAEKFSN